MTKRFAIIENGVVVNLVLADDEYAAEQGWVFAPDYVDGKVLSTKWLYNGSTFIQPDVVITTKPEPTKEELLAQLAELTAKIQTL